MSVTTCGNCEHYHETLGGSYCTNPNSIRYYAPTSEFNKACKEKEEIKDVDK